MRNSKRRGSGGERERQMRSGMREEERQREWRERKTDRETDRDQSLADLS